MQMATQFHLMRLIKIKLLNSFQNFLVIFNLKKTLFLYMILLFSSSAFANTDSIQFESIPDWKFNIKQSKDKLFSHGHKNFIGTLSKIRGDLAATLFVFKVSSKELIFNKRSVLGFLQNELLGQDLKFLEEKIISKNIKLRTYKKDQVIVYVYIYLNSKNIYYLTQDSTENTKNLDLDATQFELSKMVIVDNL